MDNLDPAVSDGVQARVVVVEEFAAVRSVGSREMRDGKQVSCRPARVGDANSTAQINDDHCKLADSQGFHITGPETFAMEAAIETEPPTNHVACESSGELGGFVQLASEPDVEMRTTKCADARLTQEIMDGEAIYVLKIAIASGANAEASAVSSTGASQGKPGSNPHSL